MCAYFCLDYIGKFHIRYGKTMKIPPDPNWTTTVQLNDRWTMNFLNSHVAFTVPRPAVQVQH